MQKLLVRAVGSVMVQDYDAMQRGTRRFVGRKLDPEQGETWVDPVTQLQHRQAVFVPLEEPEAVPFRVEYLKELRAGNLEPADEATAKLANVPWKPAAPVKKEK